MKKKKQPKLVKLTRAESKLLFAIKACMPKRCAISKIAAAMNVSSDDKRLKKSLKGLVSKGILTSIDRKDQTFYRMQRPEETPNFLIASLPETFTAENGRYIRLKSHGNLDELNIQFVIRVKDIYRHGFKPGQKILCTFTGNKLPKEKEQELSTGSEPIVAVEPFFGFSEHRKTYYTHATVRRKNRSHMRLESQFLEGDVASKASGLKVGSTYKVAIGQSFCPFAPMARIRDKDPIYNPNASENDFLHLMDRLDLPYEHSEDLEKAAQEVNDAAGPFIKTSKHTSKFIVSIDSASTRCIDDAFTLEKHANGYTQETFFVATPLFFDMNSPFFDTAVKYGWTVYKGDQAVCSNIPKALSDHKASLHEGQATPVLTVRTEYDHDGRRLKQSFTDTFSQDVIAVTKNMTPGSFDYALREGDPNITVYREFMQARRHALSQQEKTPLRQIFNNCNDVGYAMRVTDPNQISHRLVEDRMVNANNVAGEFLMAKAVPAIFRNFGLSRSPAYYDHMRYNLSKLPGRLDNIIPANAQDHTSKDIANLLDAAALIGQLDDVVAVLKQAAPKDLTQGYYAPIPRGHGAIGLNAYATISSASRRGTCLINQAQILSLLGCDIPGAEKLQDMDYMQQVSNHLTDVELRQNVLFKQSARRRLKSIFVEKAGPTEAALITRITPVSAVITYDGFNLVEYFNQNDLKESGLEIDSQREELVLPSYYSGRSEKRFTAGDSVNVRIQKDTHAQDYKALIEP